MPPFESTFRPQEALTAQVLAGVVRTVRALRPQLVIQGGDLIDNDQSNELAHALAVLGGGTRASRERSRWLLRCAVGDRPRPVLLPARRRRAAPPGAAAGRHAARSAGRGLGAPSYPVLGDHDVLVAGELAPTE